MLESPSWVAYLFGLVVLVAGVIIPLVVLALKNRTAFVKQT